MKRGGIDKRKRRKVAWVQVKSVIEKSVNALPADSCRSPFPQSKLWGINRAPLSADRPAQSECNCLQRHRFRPCTPYICTDDVSCNRRGVVTRALQALKVPVNCANEPERCLIFLPKFYILVFIYSLPPPLSSLLLIAQLLPIGWTFSKKYYTRPILQYSRDRIGTKKGNYIPRDRDSGAKVP